LDASPVPALAENITANTADAASSAVIFLMMLLAILSPLH